jgi:hypothetical protein
MPTPECRTTVSDFIACTLDTMSGKISWGIALIAASMPGWHWSLNETLATLAGITGLLLALLNCYLTVLKIRAIKQHYGRDETDDE